MNCRAHRLAIVSAAVVLAVVMAGRGSAAGPRVEVLVEPDGGIDTSVPAGDGGADGRHEGGRHVFVLSGLGERLGDAGSPPSESWGRWREIFPVRVATGDAADELPAMAGRYEARRGGVAFIPAFPLRPGVRYRAEFRPEAWSGGGAGDASGDRLRVVAVEFQAPERPARPATRVAGIFPTSAVLPANQLRFYIHFSAPMSQGHAYRNVALVRADGSVVELPFLELAEELWDPDNVRFTLFLDPGRVKRGLKPHEDEGPPLEEGAEYELVVRQGWRDASGVPLGDETRKRFSVGPADYSQPDPSGWSTTAPAGGTREPVVVRFPKAMDHGLLQHLLVVRDAGGREIPGAVSVRDHEREWAFSPASPWEAGACRIEVDTRLEDGAGNSIARPFERRDGLAPQAQADSAPPIVVVPFEVRGREAQAAEPAPSAGPAAAWPHWRGPGQNSVVEGVALPFAWSAETGANIAWKSALEGDGASTPIVAGGRVFVTGQVGRGEIDDRSRGGPGDRAGAEASEVREFLVESFRLADGAREWVHRLVPSGDSVPVHRMHNLASPSCTTDGSRVVALFATGQLVCLDLEGHLLWERHLGIEEHPFKLMWGHGSSPVLAGGRLLVLCDHDPAACLLALDPESGRTLWRVDRGSGLRSYSTPLAVAIEGRPVVIVNSNPGIDAYDAEDGAHLWRWAEFCKVPVPAPTLLEDGVSLIASRGYTSGPFLSLDPRGQGGVDASRVLWRVASQAPYVSSVLAYRGSLYLSAENGRVLICDPSGGEVLFADRIGTAFWSSPLGGDGKVYLLDESGETIVLAAAHPWEVLSRNPLGEASRGSIAAAQGRLLIRTAGHLFCIGG